MACTPKPSETTPSKTPVVVASSLAMPQKAKPFVEILEQPEGHAWWLRTRYNPTEVSIRGIAAASLNPSWCKVQELTADSFPNNVFEKSFGSDENRLFIANPFANLKRAHFLVIGAYETCDRLESGLVTVLADSTNTPPTVLDISHDGERDLKKGMGITVFAKQTVKEVDASVVNVWYCTECDHGSILSVDHVNSKMIFKSNMDNN